MLDPLLTPHGEEQCRQLSRSFPYNESISLIVVSPLRRTIHTALLSLYSPITDRKVPIIALPELQEIGDLACDTGSDLDVLSKEMADTPVDLSLVEKGWQIKEGRWAPTGGAIEKRAREARQWLRARPEKEIALVAHGGLLHYLTEDWSGSERYTGKIALHLFKYAQIGVSSMLSPKIIFKLYLGYTGTGWANTEFRSYQFVVGEEGDNASFTETTESYLRRRGEETPLTDAEKLQLGSTAKESWVRAGYITSSI